jgi:hypothetical protein
MENLIPLSILDEATPQAISELNIEDLMSLNERLNNLIETLKKRKVVLEDALTLKFNHRAQESLKLTGRDTGTARFREGNFNIVAELPKKVIWDQERLSSIVDKIPLIERKQYVKVTYSIDERKYITWPDNIKSSFAEARTVELAKPRFKITTGGNQ